jgi:S-adenosylmethionine synthetase
VISIVLCTYNRADRVTEPIDAVLASDPSPGHARVACETMVTTGLVIVAGEVRTESYVDIAGVARGTITPQV